MPNDFLLPGSAGMTAARTRTPPPERSGTVSEEVEFRAGVEPLELLLTRRRDLVKRVAVLRAVHGPFGTWDAQRKIELSRIKTLVRAQATMAKAKMNNDQVDEEAHAHPDYTAFITTAIKERAEFYRLESEIEDVDYRINRGQALLRYAASEPKG